MPRPPLTELSDAQRKIAHAIAHFERTGEPVFVSRLVAALRYADESGLRPTLQKMERNGFLSVHGRGRGHAAIVQLTPRGRFEVAAGGLPLLGSIPAGPLEEAVAEADHFVDECELLPWKPGDFLLRVKGDSMREEILPGDKVLLRPNTQINNGEIAAALVGDAHEATLKRVFFEPKKKEVILRACNRKYRDIIVPADELKIAGVFRGLIRDENSATHR